MDNPGLKRHDSPVRVILRRTADYVDNGTAGRGGAPLPSSLDPSPMNGVVPLYHTDHENVEEAPPTYDGTHITAPVGADNGDHGMGPMKMVQAAWDDDEEEERRPPAIIDSCPSCSSANVYGEGKPPRDMHCFDCGHNWNDRDFDPPSLPKWHVETPNGCREYEVDHPKRAVRQHQQANGGDPGEEVLDLHRAENHPGGYTDGGWGNTYPVREEGRLWHGAQPITPGDYTYDFIPNTRDELLNRLSAAELPPTDPSALADQNRIEQQQMVGGGKTMNPAYDAAQERIQQMMQQRVSHPLHKAVVQKQSAEEYEPWLPGPDEGVVYHGDNGWQRAHLWDHMDESDNSHGPYRGPNITHHPDYQYALDNGWRPIGGDKTLDHQSRGETGSGSTYLYKKTPQGMHHVLLNVGPEDARVNDDEAEDSVYGDVPDRNWRHALSGEEGGMYEGPESHATLADLVDDERARTADPKGQGYKDFELMPGYRNRAQTQQGKGEVLWRKRLRNAEDRAWETGTNDPSKHWNDPIPDPYENLPSPGSLRQQQRDTPQTPRAPRDPRDRYGRGSDGGF